MCRLLGWNTALQANDANSLSWRNLVSQSEPHGRPGAAGHSACAGRLGKEFNRLGLCVVCPITQGGQQSRYAGFAVTLMGASTETQGIAMCNQPRTIDLIARNGRFVEDVSDELIEEVLAPLQPIFEG
jgi:mRNA interferase ChpB